MTNYRRQQMAIKAKAKEVANEVKDFALDVNKGFDEDLDGWLVKWAKSPVSGWIAVGFGVALLVIGFVAGKVL